VIRFIKLSPFIHKMQRWKTDTKTYSSNR